MTEPLRMLETSSVLLLIAALGGITMAIMRFAGRPKPPSWLAMLHGFLAAAAFTLLAYAAATVGLPSLALVALVLFAAAAAIGVVLNLRYHLAGDALPKSTMIVHAGIAAVGFVLLLIATFNARG